MHKKLYWMAATAMAVGIMWCCDGVACAQMPVSFVSDAFNDRYAHGRPTDVLSLAATGNPAEARVLANQQECAPNKTESPGEGKTERQPEQTQDEVQDLKERILDVQNKGKLGFRKLVACGSVEGFGVYSPLVPGQKVHKIVFYCEPSNVSTLKSGDRYVIDCAVDCILMNDSGRVLGGRQNALRINRVSRSPVIDLYFKFDIALKKSPERGILLKTVLHDKIKNASVAAIQKINVEGPPKTKLDGI